MKKILSILLVVTLLFSALSVSAFALTGSDIATRYDFALNVAQKDQNNNIIGYTSDGKVTLDDARAVLRVSAGLEAPREGVNYDVDGDGFVTVSDVKAIIGIGECRERVRLFGEKNKIDTYIYEYLRDSFDKIKEIAKENDVVLLSPASASWDQYKECEVRGDEFRDLVNKL